jgi:hypothetical protein
VLSDSELSEFHDIEFSLDYPTEREQDSQRGSGNWERISDPQERLEALRDFYQQNVQRYPEAAADFFKQHPQLK